jgi:hypothetical protein
MKIIVSLILILGPFVLKAQTQDSLKNVPIISFSEKSHDFGDVKQEENELKWIFEFKNTGNSTLKITDVVSTTGSVCPIWSKEPIASGKTGKITILFKINGKQGLQNKTITIFSNSTTSPDRVWIKANIVK